MTTNSTRRAAEAHLIDAAYVFDELYNNSGTAEESKAARTELFDAVNAHRLLGLELPNLPVLSNNTTDTSGEAGASLTNIAGVARQCYDEIILAGGLTVDQLEVALNGRHQTISARVNQLRDGGWVIDSGIRRKTRSNRNAIVWRPTAQALQSTWASTP